MLSLTWIALGLASGSMPWPVWLGKWFAGSDIRAYGDKNPGSANAWKAGGWRLGGAAFLLDFSKGAVPVFLAVRLGGLEGLSLTAAGLAPIVGHAFSPLLKLRGGKALATSVGVWTALTAGEAFVLLCFVLAVGHAVQKTDAWTVILSALGLLAFLLVRFPDPYIMSIWSGNLVVIVLKHRESVQEGIVPRRWVLKMLRSDAG